MALGLPSDPAQQKRLLIGALPILLLFAYWYFLHGDYRQEVVTMQTRLETLETLNATARLRSTQSRELEERLEVFERHIDRLEDLVPRNEEVSQLLFQINQRAEQMGVEVARFTPGATDAGAHYNRRTFEMTVRGTYHNVARFLTEVGSLPRIITPTGLTIAPHTTRSREGGQMLNASFELVTYVLPEPRPAGPQGAAGA
ncbi:MAG TPA: type 4a pilus biogenesis protein PilO [Longimicrobiales bacterium]|nr:type 4a pilus biogenesis protein PilO [Longimicrobiales bacterium]